MSAGYASILAKKYYAEQRSSMQEEVELAFVVTEVLAEITELSEPWAKLHKAARGLMKTRAKRSKTRFRMQFIKAINSSDLSIDTLPQEPAGRDLPQDREDKFRLRVSNPQFLRRGNSPIVPPSKIAPAKDTSIISEDRSNYQEREDEFSRRITEPRSFRRSN